MASVRTSLPPRHAWIALLGMAACSPGAGSRPEPLPVVLRTPDPCPSGAASPGCAESTRVDLAAEDTTCINGPAGARCDGLLLPREEKPLALAIEATQKEVHHGGFSDVGLIVELARLQLWQDMDIADTDGETDAVRGLKNAKRAVAVDDASVEGRFVVALGIARSLQGTAALSSAATRELALGLVDVALRAVPASGGPIGAATKALEGYLALELGRRTEARAAFEYATQIDAGLATAWMGLGDAARSEGQFEAAEDAYTRASLLRPADPGARRSIQAAKRKELLALAPSPGAPRGAISVAPLAPAFPPPPVCPAPPTATAPGAALCKGLAELAKAASRDDHEKGARLVIDGWQEMLPLCEARDPACGPHVAQAMAAASRGFQATGRPTRAIAAAKMLLGRPDLPGVAVVAPALHLEIGDRYFSVAMFDKAAEHYTLHARLGGASAGAAVDRAMALHAALVNVDAATRLAGELAVNNKHSEAARAGWLLLAAGVVRAVRGAGSAVEWIQPHRALVAAAGPKGALEELSVPGPESAAPPGEACAAPLACAVRRLAGDARWSPKSGVLSSPARPSP